MQLRNLTILTVSTFFIFIGCKSNSTGTSGNKKNLPNASFSVDGDLYTGGNVTFKNTSSNATSYEWQFGDGTTANESNPTKIFSKYDSFSVTLTAKNADGDDSSTKTIIIEPSKMFIKGLEVVNFSFANSSGRSWDVSSGPDVFVNIANDSNEVFTLVDTQNNVTPSNLPLSYAFHSPGYEIGRVDFESNFTFVIADEDQISNNELISSVPSDYFTIKDRWLKDTPDSATLESDQSEIRLTLGWE